MVMTGDVPVKVGISFIVSNMILWRIFLPCCFCGYFLSSSLGDLFIGPIPLLILSSEAAAGLRTAVTSLWAVLLKIFHFVHLWSHPIRSGHGYYCAVLAAGFFFFLFFFFLTLCVVSELCALCSSCEHHKHGGCGFFLACKDFGRMFNHSFPTYAFSFFLSGV